MDYYESNYDDDFEDDFDDDFDDTLVEDYDDGVGEDYEDAIVEDYEESDYYGEARRRRSGSSPRAERRRRRRMNRRPRGRGRKPIPRKAAPPAVKPKEVKQAFGMVKSDVKSLKMDANNAQNNNTTGLVISLLNELAFSPKATITELQTAAAAEAAAAAAIAKAAEAAKTAEAAIEASKKADADATNATADLKAAATTAAATAAAIAAIATATATATATAADIAKAIAAATPLKDNTGKPITHVVTNYESNLAPRIITTLMGFLLTSGYLTGKRRPNNKLLIGAGLAIFLFYDKFKETGITKSDTTDKNKDLILGISSDNLLKIGAIGAALYLMDRNRMMK